MKRKTDLVFVVFFVSGFAGLIYQSIWSHYAKLFLGHAAYAQTLVLVVFIGGLALGSWLCSRFADRVRNPLRIYAFVELAIGLMAIVSHRVFVATIDWSFASLLPNACGQATAFCPAQWLVTASLLAPQSILLGATFPLVCSAVLRLEGTQAGHDISTLYFVNSFGAVLGVLASAFVLIPGVGLPGTLMTAGLLNVALALTAWAASRVPPPALAIPQMPATAETDPSAGSPRFIRILLITAFLTGLSSFIYEIVWIRMLSLVLGASTHSFELMLASFILGLALGGLWIRNRIDQIDDPVRFLAIVQLLMGTAAAATVPLYIGSFDFMAWLLSSVARTEGGYLIFSLTSTLISLLVMLPATFCAGMTLPLITYRLLRSKEGERALGKVYAVNTLGGIAGVVIAVHLLLGALGLHFTLMVGAAIDIGLGVFVLAFATRPEVMRASLRGAIPAAVVALAVIAFVFPIDPRRSASGVFRTGAARMAANVQIPFNKDGKTATVTIAENAEARSIRTNGKPDASISFAPGARPTGDEFTMMMLGVLPLGHKPDAKTAAVIGFGSGMSTTMLLASPKLERVDTVEIEPAMVEGARHFQPFVDAAYKDPRSHIVIDDAKSYFARGKERYDIIVSEPSNPWVSGVASLFTEEFYARLSGYLNEGGVLSQWLHTYEMDSATLASILAAVSKTFPDYVIYSSIDSDIILIARKGGAPGTLDTSVLELPALQAARTKLKMTDPEVVLRRRMGSARMMGPLFATGIVGANSDYYPIVEQRASKTRFTQARVNDITAIVASAAPLEELLDQGRPPSAQRYDTELVTVLEFGTADAWRMHDAIVGGSAAGSAPIVGQKELAARLVAQWSATCAPDLPFDRMLPTLVMVAEGSNPYLNPRVAMEIWNKLRDSPCGRKLTGPYRQWMDLFAANAARDTQTMAALGEQVLAGTRGAHNPASEYAFITTVAALVCRGDKGKARAYLTDSGTWMRPEIRNEELRMLRGIAFSPAGGATCAASG
jgi:spermidine synthase